MGSIATVAVCSMRLSLSRKKISGVAGGLRRQKIFQALAESETGASRNFIRSHAGDELVRRVEIELRLIEHVDVVLERGDLQSIEIDRDTSLVDGVAVEILVLAKEVARLINHLEEIRHDAVMRPDERVVNGFAVLRDQRLNAIDAELEMLELVLEEIRGDAVRLVIAVRRAGEELVQTDGETLDHQVLNDQTAGEVLLLCGVMKMLTDIRPLRLDHRVVDREAEMIGELLEEKDVFALLVRLMNGGDLRLRVRHERDHLGIVVDGHDLATARVGNDERQKLHVAFVPDEGIEAGLRRDGSTHRLLHFDAPICSVSRYHRNSI